MTDKQKVNKMARECQDENTTVVESDCKAWAFTIKKLGNEKVCMQDYCCVISKFHHAGHIEFCVAENDSLGKLHLHGILLLPKHFFRKKVCTPGYHIYLKECTEKDVWMKYIQKDLNDPVFDNTQWMFDN